MAGDERVVESLLRHGRSLYPFQAPLDLWRERSSRTCDLCGTTELVSPVHDTIFFCEKCIARIPKLDQLSAEGRIMLTPNASGIIKCDVCGSVRPVMFAIAVRWLCMRCSWYVLGRKSRRLAIGGTRII